MGYGDDVIATSLAKGAAARGEKIAFGDGNRIIWGPYSEMVFKNNPNIARSLGEKGLTWLPYYKGHRIYNKADVGRWIWNYGFRVQPGEFFFDADEDIHGQQDDLILIEPHVPNKACGPNKQWPVDRWRAVADRLQLSGFHVRQFEHVGTLYKIAPLIRTQTFRSAAALLKSARLAILPEGGLHHAAAAVGTPAVVIFGGFVPPEVLGYESHINLTGGARACGTFTKCDHCVAAMHAISVEEVLKAAEELIARCR